MKTKDSIGLLMATELEAAPLIADYGFAAVEGHPFPVYACEHIILVLSGIGKANAAAAAAWMITAFQPGRVINAGAAGATGNDADLGDIFQIDTVFEADRPRLNGQGVETFSVCCTDSLPTATLATRDRVVTSTEERCQVAQYAKLVDMEGAAVAGICDRFGVPVSLIKFVSDSHDGHNIAENIIRLRGAFCEKLFARLQ